jgi:hypothetical protein
VVKKKTCAQTPTLGFPAKVQEQVDDTVVRNLGFQIKNNQYFRIKNFFFFQKCSLILVNWSLKTTTSMILIILSF